MEPYEIIAAPFTVWFAPVGEAFPTFDADPAGNWAKIGTSGDENYSEDGVTVVHSQTTEKTRVLGTTGPRKAFRTQEDMMVRFTLFDMTLENYKHALNGNPVTTTAAGSGTAGFKKIGLRQGLEVSTMALLVRGNASAYGPDWKAQFEVPRCFQSGSPEQVFRKGLPAGLALAFDALEDSSAASADERFGRLKIQHQTAL
ncbi:hypothetical protein K1W69_17505 [Hoeflea sp. WL0058]|uniref:Uncharacterized protein n=1 Tax=Flavimaribacter sediminis TaxID=2865987 RepID=A0AAE2ZQP5_9HYPH|nr:hypothetical protein [Flavimaribacter sediminis]MBW8638997.1 hypothetical protein [Flavimaribacter sediminis]